MNITRRYYYGIRDSRILCFMIQPRHPYKVIRHWLWKRKVNQSLRVLDALDWHLKREGWSRQKRQQFWRDFAVKRRFRVDVLNQLTQQ